MASSEYKCCNKQELRDAYLVVWFVRLPCHLCVECGEVMSNPKNIIHRILFTLLIPFWNGGIEVNDEAFEAERYR